MCVLCLTGRGNGSGLFGEHHCRVVLWSHTIFTVDPKLLILIIIFPWGSLASLQKDLSISLSLFAVRHLGVIQGEGAPRALCTSPVSLLCV